MKNRGLFGILFDMRLEETLNMIQENNDFKELITSIKAGNSETVAVGSSARSYFLASFFKSVNRPILVITSGSEKARKLVEDLKAYSIEAELFAEVETMPYDSLSPSPASVGRRLAALNDMESGKLCIWVTSIQSAMRVMPPPSAALHYPLKLSVGEEIDLHDLAKKLTAICYTRVSLVESPGHFSLRGGILDVFPSHAQKPVRVELFGDEIDSIRIFNVSDQRSIGYLSTVKIYGCRQVALTKETISTAASKFPDLSSDWLEEEIGKVKDGQYFEGIDKYLPFLYEEDGTVLDYLPKEALRIIDEPEETRQAAVQHYNQQLSYIEHLVDHQTILKPPHPYFKRPKDIFTSRIDIELVSVGKVERAGKSFKASPIPYFGGKVEQLKSLIVDYLNLGFRIAIVLPDENQRTRIEQILLDSNISSTRSLSASKRQVLLAIGNLNSGFVSHDLKIAIISFADIFGRRSHCRVRRIASRRYAISDISDVKVGDYVVHSVHGIAIYGGLRKREVNGVVRDYALLEYAGSDRLFVPIDQLDRITKYIGAAGEVPTISRLGSADWLKATKKAKASAKKVAYDLLTLYALRANAKGIRFSPDTPWQQELEDSFAYEETPDQLAAVEDVKRDMESSKPMDRLICGDVGYGKTEVAVRAAFKAVMDGKQVMVLVPTTILAQQHHMTFTDRLSPFPVTVEMVSRFKSKQQQNDIISRFNEGKVDILIGTHRLLQDDVRPLDLGLVIIDEEQRFGVNHKEKLRNFKKSIDVLTLSATPIPRTLQMSLAGIRDMSIIETPPGGRQPVITHVGGYDEEMVIQAIRRELGRGGQVYLVHNRVETISGVADRVRELVPEARVAVAHGQMSEHQLEKVMLGFLDHRYDVLVCTTIIESGIDIPSVNTLIVDRAELLGLAQLYQLRGRVGRTNQRAYAYFFFSSQRLLTMQAFERLKTISDFTELGSGIKIAMRDLEIRGAGNLLGAEQHGHMSAVGFELYCQMLRDAIDELEGKQVTELAEVKVDLPINAYIPDAYIAEEGLRIEIYRRIIMSCKSTEIDQIALELRDRFGPLPEPVKNLLDIGKLRLLARKLGVSEISYRNNRIKVSPLLLTKQQEIDIASKHNNLIFNRKRQYLLITKPKIDKTITFLLALFDVIIGELTTGVMISQKAR
ncbi:MAG: transcription-repair coupling factor [Actinomycetota bacterium]